MVVVKELHLKRDADRIIPPPGHEQRSHQQQVPVVVIHCQTAVRRIATSS